MKRTAFLTALLLLPVLAFAQDATITVRKGDTTSLAIRPLGGSDGAAASQVLQNDLQLSGWFGIVSPAEASYAVGGTASGGSLQGEVIDHGGGVILQKTYSGNPRSAAHQFADDIVETITGNKGIANTRIAFVSSRTGRKELYLADYDGKNVRQLTHDNSISVGPSLSWDGRELAYTGYLAGYADIYKIDLSSGARTRIIKFPGTNTGAAFSPDGRRIACTLSRDGNPEIYIVDSDGGGARRLTHTRAAVTSPTWAPDSGEIIYSSDENGSPQLFRIGVGGGTGQAISTGGGAATRPNWSPDGRKVAYTIGEGNFSIGVKDLNTGATRVVASGKDPVWGADSRHLIYSTGSELILLDTANGRSTPIVTTLGGVTEPTWSHQLR
jgi:TolB protein